MYIYIYIYTHLYIYIYIRTYVSIHRVGKTPVHGVLVGADPLHRLLQRVAVGVVVVVGRGLQKYMYIGSACLMLVDLFVCAAVLLFVIPVSESSTASVLSITATRMACKLSLFVYFVV